MIRTNSTFGGGFGRSPSRSSLTTMVSDAENSAEQKQPLVTKQVFDGPPPMIRWVRTLVASIIIAFLWGNLFTAGQYSDDLMNAMNLTTVNATNNVATRNEHPLKDFNFVNELEFTVFSFAMMFSIFTKTKWAETHPKTMAVTWGLIVLIYCFGNFGLLWMTKNYPGYFGIAVGMRAVGGGMLIALAKDASISGFIGFENNKREPVMKIRALMVVHGLTTLYIAGIPYYSHLMPTATNGDYWYANYVNMTGWGTVVLVICTIVMYLVHPEAKDTRDGMTLRGFLGNRFIRTTADGKTKDFKISTYQVVGMILFLVLGQMALWACLILPWVHVSPQAVALKIAHPERVESMLGFGAFASVLVVGIMLHFTNIFKSSTITMSMFLAMSIAMLVLLGTWLILDKAPELEASFMAWAFFYGYSAWGVVFTLTVIASDIASFVSEDSKLSWFWTNYVWLPIGQFAGLLMTALVMYFAPFTDPDSTPRAVQYYAIGASSVMLACFFGVAWIYWDVTDELDDKVSKPFKESVHRVARNGFDATRKTFTRFSRFGN